MKTTKLLSVRLLVVAMTICSYVCGQRTYVDLGLPSGTKWATCNIGASKPEDCGNYYAWGEIYPKSISINGWDSYRYGKAPDRITKYCTYSIYGKNDFIDKKIVLDLSDDAANINWGSPWRMPTKDEWDELIWECTWTWIMRNGVNGYEIIGANGNSIFLPAAGMIIEYSAAGVGGYGNYWSSSLDTSLPYQAWYLGFQSKDMHKARFDRTNVISVRPVCK